MTNSNPGGRGTAPRAPSRRAVLIGCAAAAASAGAAGCGVAAAKAGGTASDAVQERGEAGTPRSGGWFVPADHMPHSRTWMAWPARKDIWGAMLPGVRGDVARVARAVARFEPVAMVARPDQAREAARACGTNVEIVQLVNDDLWMRDMGPVFLINGHGGLAGLDLNFNGWGDKQVHPNDARIAREVLALLGVKRFRAPFVSEGGALEADGHGTVMATESSIINPNRNPGQPKGRLTTEICGYLGARKMIWVPGLKGHDITDDHIDSLAQVRPPGRGGRGPIGQPPRHGCLGCLRAAGPRHPAGIDRRGRPAAEMPHLPRVADHPAAREPEPLRQRVRQLVRVQQRRPHPGVR